MVLPNAIAPFSHDTINNKYRTTTTPATTTTTPVSSSDDNEHPTMRLIYHTAVRYLKEKQVGTDPCTALLSIQNSCN